MEGLLFNNLTLCENLVFICPLYWCNFIGQFTSVPTVFHLYILLSYIVLIFHIYLTAWLQTGENLRTVSAGFCTSTPRTNCNIWHNLHHKSFWSTVCQSKSIDLPILLLHLCRKINIAEEQVLMHPCLNVLEVCMCPGLSPTWPEGWAWAW
jgi:hypothetical protein